MLKKLIKWQFIILALLIGALNISCDSQLTNEKCNLEFSINCKNLITRTRNIFPTEDAEIITQYQVCLTGPNDESQSINLTNKTGTIQDLVPGYWNISINAMNAKNNILANGSKIIYLNKKLTQVEVILDKVIGKGLLEADFSWNPKQTNEKNTQLVYDIISDKGVSFKEQAQLAICADRGYAVISIDGIPSGSYVVSAKLVSNDVCIAGIVEPAKVVNGGRSLDHFNFIIGDQSNVFDISIIKNVLLPIEGTLICDSENIKLGSSFTLTFTPNNLPEGLTEKDLSYLWFLEGDLIEGENSNTLTDSSRLGIHRYDLIIKTDREGSIGGYTIKTNVTR